MNELSHVDSRGRARMVDVSGKEETVRVATAEATVHMEAETLRMILEGEHHKGDVLAAARIAGIQGAKQCPHLIPLCHPLMITGVEVELTTDQAASAVHVRATCRITGKTGVEMEALTAASVAALTVYDMCKAVDRGMVITNVRLLEKMGGRSGHWQAEAP